MEDAYKRSIAKGSADEHNKAEILTTLEKLQTITDDIMVFLSERPEIFEVFKEAFEDIIEGYDKDFYYYDVSKEILNYHVVSMNDLIHSLPYIPERDKVRAYITVLEVLLERYMDLYERQLSED